MKNMMLMTSKIATKNFKKIMSLVLILAILLLPFVNLLNARAENATITVDDNKKVVDTTGLIVKVDENDLNEDVFKAYKVLDAYYDNITNAMTYKFTPEFSTFLTTSGDTKLASLTVDDYIAYGYAQEDKTNDTEEELTKKQNLQKEYNSMIASFAKYIKKGTNTLPKNYELTNNVGVSKTATVEVGSYLVLPAVLADKPNIADGYTYFNFYSALIANAVYRVEIGSWVLRDCEVSYKYSNYNFLSFILNIPINNIVENKDNFDKNTLMIDRELYKDREYTAIFSVSISDQSSDPNLKLQITLPEGVTFADNSSDLNNIYAISSELNWVYPATSDGKLVGDLQDTGSATDNMGTVKVENVTTDKGDGSSVTNKVITITILPDSKINDGACFGVRIKLNSDRDKVVLGADGNVINSSYTFTVDPYTDPATTRTLTSENKAITYGLEISNKSKNDNSYLTGATFGIYTSESCTDDTKVGEINVDETIDSQIVGRYLGLPSGTYYIKQLKAATGYKTATDIASITIEPSNTTYTHLDVENAKQGLLPSTGGLGTVFYTLMGLLVVGAGAYSIIKYSKKQINS